MRWRVPALSVHTRLTLTIAGSFIGAMAIILVLGLFAARNFDIGFVSTSLTHNGEVMPPPDPEEPPEPGEPPEPEELTGSGSRSGSDMEVTDVENVYILDARGDREVLVPAPIERLPTLTRWALVTLLVFALIAVALASWISRRSLGRIAGITAMARELSERRLDRRLNLAGPDDEIKRLGDTFDSMLERLERVFANQSLFIANASHELRTPLTTARTALEIPLAQGRVPEDLRPSLEQALTANRRSEGLIAALLLLARGRLARPDLAEIDLQDTVRAVLADNQRAADAMTITTHAKLAPVTIQGSATLVTQAIANLVENAMYHNVQDGSVWVTLATTGSGAQLTIENTGRSYTAESVTRLVEPFHRHDATRTSGPTKSGFGLGLAIVESVAVMHGGSLALAPRDGGGLVATLDLPDSPPDGGTPDPDAPTPVDRTRRDGAVAY